MNKDYAVQIGVSQMGTPIMYDLGVSNRVAINGTSGSGKSVLVNNLILSYCTHPKMYDRTQFYCIDPKQVSLYPLRNRCFIESEPTRFIEVLKKIETIMNQRLFQLKEQERTTLTYEDITPEQPMVVLVIEEALSVVQNSAITKSMAAEIMKLYTALFTKIRVVNISVIMISHVFSSEALPTVARDQLTTRFLLKTANTTNIGMLAPADEVKADLITEAGQFYFNDGFSSNWILAKTFETKDAKAEEIANKYASYKRDDLGKWVVDNPFNFI